LRKIDYLAPFLAGLGIGAAASVLLSTEGRGRLRRRVREIGGHADDALKGGVDKLSDAPGKARAQRKVGREVDYQERIQPMSKLKDKAKQKIGDVAGAAKKAADIVVDKSKDVAHSAGKKIEKGGKRLQDA
jgi:hypothetical protein